MPSATNLDLQPSETLKPGDILGVDPIDEVVGKTRFVGTITYIYDPDVERRVKDFIVGCLCARLPEVLAQARTKAIASGLIPGS